MKKSFLLYTVSGVLFYSSNSLSYAIHAMTPTIDLSSPPTTSDSKRTIIPPHPTGNEPTKSTPTSTVVPHMQLGEKLRRYTRSSYGETTHSSTHPQSSEHPTKPKTSTESSEPGTITQPETPPKNTETSKASSQNSKGKTTFPNVTIENTTSSSKQKHRHARESIQTSKTKTTESLQSSLTATQSDITQSPSTEIAPTREETATTKIVLTKGTASTTGMEAKSRRRSGATTSSTDSSSEKTPPNSAVSSQSEATQSAPNLQPTPANSESTRAESTKPATKLSPTSKEPELTQPTSSRSPESVRPTPTQPTSAQKVSGNSESTEAGITRPTAEQSPVPKESERIQQTSLRIETGKPALQVPPKSVKPAPVQSSSAQKMYEKPEIEKPISPIKQYEKSTQIEDISTGVEAKNGKTITLHNKKIQDNSFAVHAEGNNSKVNMIGGTVDARFVALSVSDGGEIDATGITATAETAALVNIEGTIKLKDSSVHVTGNYEADGIIFRNNPYNAPRKRYTRNAKKNTNAVQEQDVANIADKVTLENTKLFVEHGSGINLYGTGVNGEVNLKNSEVHADILLKNIKNESASTNTITLVADHSSLEGRVRTSEDNRTVFDLKERTKWLLKANKNVTNNDNILNDYRQFGVDEKSYSNLSELHLTNSVIMFDKPVEGHYQTLFIGPNLSQEDETTHTAAVYSTAGLAEIYVNTQWDKHSPITEQQTDRVVINGDVSGSTVVHINLQTDSSAIWEERMASLPLGTHGISIIQVSGQANENSFTLAGNYTTIGEQPYKYVLTGYKPGTSHESQNLFGKNNHDFWDFRLQNAYIDKDKKVRALLPQVANYLTISNTLFSAGFTDVNNQNTLLDNMRTTVFGAKDNKKNGIFFSSYGEKVTLSSNRDPLHYGYGADINYTALQLGGILAALESKDISAYFGLLGTYGKLAFTPKEMQDSEKTTLDKWSLTAYSGIQHSNGIYVNALLSYGTLKGNITTALVGNAAKLDGTEMLNISATIGQKLATDTKGLVFEPQAQFIYQNLIFDIFSDTNGLKVDMGNPHQWLIRFGGRLTKTIMAVEENKAVSFYGKMNVIRTFGDGKTIKIADTFHVDPTGSSVEGGMGVNAYLSQNIVLNADISYRQKLQKAGVSGTNFSGGIRYRF
ncbi:autotransporter outer membrane beta-barrel domain-containing protein [Bartonella sp. AC535YNZD]|uniref:autotransporter family protein n=1 Tax=Bartonella sp. AC535YNZD TaxID=3243455 RepID=UPI0035CF0E89